MSKKNSPAAPKSKPAKKVKAKKITRDTHEVAPKGTSGIDAAITMRLTKREKELQKRERRKKHYRHRLENYA